MGILEAQVRLQPTWETSISFGFSDVLVKLLSRVGDWRGALDQLPYGSWTVV